MPGPYRVQTDAYRQPFTHRTVTAYGTAVGTATHEALSPLHALPPSVGERNPSAVLTADKVRAIRAAAAAGGRLAALAEAFGVEVRTVRHVVDGTSWRHVG